MREPRNGRTRRLGSVRSYGCVQQRKGDPDCNLVEVDLANAAYWYQHAGLPVATRLLKSEWNALIRKMFSPA